jgi:glycosyltransferase involved in cell wall biosynthesis
METLSYYQAADAFVLPSETEGLSNAMLESMACGLPVAASRVGAAVDLIEPGQKDCCFNLEM